MKSPLRILHLEDNPNDAELIQAMLETEGVISHVTRVETQADFFASIEHGDFDLILADYTLPSFDGLSALKIAAEKCPDVPFIFVSGTLGEEVAIEALKIGATDYLLKERLSRIVPSVQRALAESKERAERKRAEALLAGEKRLLEMIAKGNSLSTILDALCRLVEELSKGSLSSILLLDPDGKRLWHGAAPSLPKSYIGGIDGGFIGPAAGSCGTAAYRKEPVIVSDIAQDPLWADYRDLALPHGLRACWSTPVLASDGRVLGTFAIYFREPRSPTPQQQNIIDQVTDLASIAIERKRAEDALRKSESYLAEAQKLSHTGSFGWRLSTGEILWSEETFRIFQYDQTTKPTVELVLQRVHPEDAAFVKQTIERASQDGKDFDFEYCLLMPDGFVKHVHVVAHALDDKSGGVEFVGAVMDVTGEHQSRAALEKAFGEIKKSESRLQLVIDTIPGMVWSGLPDGTFDFVNEPWLRYLGYSWEELSARGGLVSVVHPDDVEESVARWEATRAAGRHTDHELRMRRADGQYRWFLTRALPLRDELGNIIKWYGTATDIEDRKRAEEEQKRAAEALRQAEADLAHVSRTTTMGELTASLAHEVNQPITAAITNANTCVRWLAGNTPHIEEARDAAMRSAKDGTRAAEIISRIRLLFKKGTMERELVDVNEVIREMIVLLRGEATRYAVSIQTDLAADLPQLLADRVQLQQVMLNLIMNSIDAMKDVDGTRDLAIKSQRTENEELMVSVSDTGVGLPPQQADKIFNAFFTTKLQGTGLGLSISRSIVQSHGGRLWAADNTPPGASLSFTLSTKVKAHE